MSTSTPNEKGVQTPRKEKNQKKPGVAPPAQAPPDRATVQAVLGDAQRLGTEIVPILRAPPNGRGSRVKGAWRNNLPALAALLRAHPELAPGVNPDAFDQKVALAGDLRRLSVVLHDLASKADGTYAVVAADAVRDGRKVYRVASALAVDDSAMAQAIGELQTALATGPRSKSRPKTVAGKSAHAAAMQDRAAKVQRQADRAKLAATMAEALAKADATDTVPAVTVTPPASPTHT